MDKYQKKIIDEYYQKISIFAILCSNMLTTDYDKLIESLSYEIPSSIIEHVISHDV
jgi:hypothetical protein